MNRGFMHIYQKVWNLYILQGAACTLNELLFTRCCLIDLFRWFSSALFHVILSFCKLIFLTSLEYFSLWAVQDQGAHDMGGANEARYNIFQASWDTFRTKWKWSQKGGHMHTFPSLSVHLFNMFPQSYMGCNIHEASSPPKSLR